MANLWDEGDIAEAVTKAKNIGAIFIVFIKGDNELSEQYENLFGNEEILLKLKTKHFVAIKVQQNTTAHQQFSAIYPHNSIPSIFFIGKTGKPIETITGNMNVIEFNGRIDDILHKSGLKLQEGSVSGSLIRNEQQEVARPSDNITPTTVATTSLSSNQVSSESSGDLTPEEKIEYARGLIEQKKEEKRKQEDEDKRLKEIERRKIGQNVQQMKKLQHEEELKQLMDERDKEKRENQAARERVLAQIAQDKAERASKFSKQTTTGASQIPQSVAQPKLPTMNNITKLQFRLPDGSSHTKEFQISDSLEIVHQYIQNEMQLPFTNYTLSTTFPRREFNTQESSQSLLDLQLVPNAVVLILPLNQGVVSTSSNRFIGGMLGWLLTPLLNVYKFLVGFLFSGPPTSSHVEPSNAKRPASEVEESNRKIPKKQASDSTVIKRQGNVHRLKDRPDSDDDNNTWNGNSTQQM